MQSDDQHYTYNELSNEDRALLLSHGYKPGELPSEDERDIISDLRAQAGNDIDSERPSDAVPPEERDGDI
ncbi:MAG: hypothetical protein ABI220_04195 [Candidatus Saccharimonadales bacterium]